MTETLAQHNNAQNYSIDLNMDELKSAESAIAALVKNGNRSKISKIRDLMPVIEEASRQGVTRQTIAGLLTKNGLNISADELNNAIYRIKKRQQKYIELDESKIANNASALPSVEIGERLETDLSFAPKAIDAIINTTPDLIALSKHRKGISKK